MSQNKSPFCLACEDGANNEGAPCTCGSGKSNTFPLCPCGNQGWDQGGSCTECGGSVYAEGVKKFRPPMKSAPIHCHDHRPDGPDPIIDCKCSDVDQLFRSNGRARTPLLERNPPPHMLMGARYDRIHKEVGRSRAARVGRAKTKFVGGVQEAHQLVLADLDDVCGERDRLRKALVAVQHGISEDGPCWCMYFKVIHNDEGDKLRLQDDHTAECWQAQACYNAFKDADKDLETPEGK